MTSTPCNENSRRIGGLKQKKTSWGVWIFSETYGLDDIFFLHTRPWFLEILLNYPPISVKSTIKCLIPRIPNRGLKRSS